jgi:ParB family chromosome partitioning protein
MALGRGLESLIPKKSAQAGDDSNKQIKEKKPVYSGQSSKKQESIFYIETSKIKPNPQQPRQDFKDDELNSLADSIQRHGILQPLIVTKYEIERELGRGVEYHIVAGERRWRAAKLSGLSQVPVIIRDTSEQDRLELALIENIQRSDLNPIEEAKAYQNLSENFSLTQEQISERVSRSREAVANKVRLLALPYEVQKAVIDGSLFEGHAKVLLSLKNPEKQIFLAKQAISKNWPIRILEEKIKEETGQIKKTRTSEVKIDPELEEYKKTIQETLGTMVNISGSRQKGKLAISFHSQEELDGIIKKLTE